LKIWEIVPLLKTLTAYYIFVLAFLSHILDGNKCTFLPKYITKRKRQSIV
jgi:hypothetical protein